jgi:hypothetical protein
VQVLTGFGGDAEAVEALVCKTGLSGFESHRYLHYFVNRASTGFPSAWSVSPAPRRSGVYPFRKASLNSCTLSLPKMLSVANALKISDHQCNPR